VRTYRTQEDSVLRFSDKVRSAVRYTGAERSEHSNTMACESASKKCTFHNAPLSASNLVVEKR
jgi:hypothetical protein